MYSPQTTENTAFELGHRYYELSNHLGNVLTVISDVKTPVSSGGNVASYTANIVNISDYSPFGVQLDGRTITSDRYRYGFNGMESDDEVKGDGNSYTTMFRQYDSRLGSWLTIDPLTGKYPGQSPYAVFNNNPLFYIDPLGLEGTNNGDPEKTYNQKLDPVEVGGKGVSKIRAKINRFMLRHSIGKYRDSKYDQARAERFGTREEYEKARDQVSVNAKKSTTDQLTTSDFVNLYKMYGWSRFDPNVASGQGPNASYSAKKAEEDWMYDAPSFCKMVGKGTNVLMLGVAGGAIFEVSIPILPHAAEIGAVAARTSYQAAKAYHYTFGKNGGYANMFADLGLQKLADPNGKTNYYSFIGSGFLPGNGFKKIAAFELSTAFINVQSDKMTIALPDNNVGGNWLFNKTMDAYSNSKFGTPFLGLYWKSSGAIIQGEIKNKDK